MGPARGEAAHHLITPSRWARSQAENGPVPLVLDDADGPLLMVSAGIGCTPMAGMLEHLAATGAARGDGTRQDHRFLGS